MFCFDDVGCSERKAAYNDQPYWEWESLPFVYCCFPSIIDTHMVMSTLLSTLPLTYRKNSINGPVDWTSSICDSLPDTVYADRAKSVLDGSEQTRAPSPLSPSDTFLSSAEEERDARLDQLDDTFSPASHIGTLNTSYNSTPSNHAPRFILAQSVLDDIILKPPSLTSQLRACLNPFFFRRPQSTIFHPRSGYCRRFDTLVSHSGLSQYTRPSSSSQDWSWNRSWVQSTR